MSTPKKPSDKSGRLSERVVWTQLLGIGIEFGAVIAIFTFGGYWADQHFQTEPWCLLGGFFFALTGMTYLIIKRTIHMHLNDSD